MSDVIFCFSLVIYSFEGAGLVLSLEASMPEKTRHKFVSYFSVSLALATVFYVVFGALESIAYGEDTREMVTLNLTGYSSVVVKFCFCFSLFFSYPLMLFPLTALVESRMDHHSQGPPGTKSSFLQRMFLRATLVLGTSLVVTSFGNISLLLEAVGAVFCTTMGFVIPSLCHLRMFYPELSTVEKAADAAAVAIGLSAAAAGINDIAKGWTGSGGVMMK